MSVGKKQGDLFGRARNGSARDEKHMQVMRALWTARAFRPTRFIQRDLRFEEAKIGRKKKEERKKEKRKRGCALINMSYKNAGVHNLHEPKTESKNRYALSLSSAFLSVWSVSSLCSTDLFRSLSSSSPSLSLFLSRLSFHRVTRNTMDK